MLENLADALVWIVRLVLFAGLAWGAWLCVSHELERFVTFALLVLLLTTLGGFLHAR